jgi:hypothetical protein
LLFFIGNTKLFALCSVKIHRVQQARNKHFAPGQDFLTRYCQSSSGGRNDSQDDNIFQSKGNDAYYRIPNWNRFRSDFGIACIHCFKNFYESLIRVIRPDQEHAKIDFLV